MSMCLVKWKDKPTKVGKNFFFREAKPSWQITRERLWSDGRWFPWLLARMQQVFWVYESSKVSLLLGTELFHQLNTKYCTSDTEQHKYCSLFQISNFPKHETRAYGEVILLHPPKGTYDGWGSHELLIKCVPWYTNKHFHQIRDALSLAALDCPIPLAQVPGGIYRWSKWSSQTFTVRLTGC